MRLLREIRERGYTGGYSAVTDFLRETPVCSRIAAKIRHGKPDLRPSRPAGGGGPAAGGQTSWASLRDQAGSAGPGRFRLFRGRVHGHARYQAGGLALYDGARLQPLSLGPVLPEPEAGGCSPLPYRRVR